MRYLMLAVIIIGCVDSDGPSIVRECGPAPLAPGYAVGFETVNGLPRAIMTMSDFEAIRTWRVNVERWQTCALNQP